MVCEIQKSFIAEFAWLAENSRDIWLLCLDVIPQRSSLTNRIVYDQE